MGYTFKSEHTGGKSKEALAQEIWSLENQAGMIKTKQERLNFKVHLAAAKFEWSTRFGNEDYAKFWNKVFKTPK